MWNASSKEADNEDDDDDEDDKSDGETGVHGCVARVRSTHCHRQQHTHTHTLYSTSSEHVTPRGAGTDKTEPVRVTGSGFDRPDALPLDQPTASKH